MRWQYVQENFTHNIHSKHITTHFNENLVVSLLFLNQGILIKVPTNTMASHCKARMGCIISCIKYVRSRHSVHIILFMSVQLVCTACHGFCITVDQKVFVSLQIPLNVAAQRHGRHVQLAQSYINILNTQLNHDGRVISLV